MSDISVRDAILNAAEQRMRAVGYNAVSFRQLADDVRIKSSSLHYYFRQKGDLGSELVDRYTRNFKERLESADMSDLHAAVADFLRLYAEALKVGETVCLCAMLGAEANSLPNEVKAKVAAFFQTNIDWLTELNLRHRIDESVISPVEIVSHLEGAMIVASAKEDRAILDKTIERISDRYRMAEPVIRSR